MSEFLAVRSPFDHHLIAELALAGEKEVEAALSKAHALFIDESRRLPKFRRIEILERLAFLMEQQAEKLALRAAEEGGKPYQDSKIEVLRAINGVKIAIASLYNLKGEEIPMGLTAPSINRLAFTTHEPIGVVLAISAFNHPVNLIIHQVIPAIAAGCPVIVKPASTTPLSCFGLVKLLNEAGLPENHCIPLVCSRALTEKMASDSRLGYLSFIGSHEVGWHLRSILAHGTRCALEHGGVAPVIVDKNADSNLFLPGILKGGFYHAGQVCVSVQRVFIHEDIAMDVSEALSSGAVALKIGNPLDASTEVGPLITTNDVNRVDEWVKEARSAGGKVLTGGEPLSDTLYKPTIIWDPPSDVKVSSEEVFGPVICIYPYKDKDEAINRANSLRFAFQAAVYSKDIDLAMEVSQRLNASTVMINDHTAFRVDWMPFGGRDESGIGIGGIPYSIREMTREKLLVIKSPGLH